jgi:hypothetical protein
MTKQDSHQMQLTARLEGVFGSDQLEHIRRGGMRGKAWSDSSVKKGLQLRFACGTSGYEVLLKMGLPFPSVRCLQYKVENINFLPGLLPAVFNLLTNKIHEMKPQERLCALSFDEMSLESAFEYQVETGAFIGEATIPTNSKDSGVKQLATKGLVFNLGGLSTRWKQIVAYHLTGNSIDPESLKAIVLDIINQCSKIGLHVMVIVCDMGPCNQALWKLFGITATRTIVVNKIPHPTDPDNFLYFLPDVPHVLKNIRNCFVQENHFFLSQEIVNKFELKSNVVSVKPVKGLFIFQADDQLKISPKLTSKVLDPSSHFNKMNVSNATKFFDRRNSAAMRLLVEEENRDVSNLTVAWFIEVIALWFEYCSNRSRVMALSMENPDKFNAAISHLNDVIDIFSSLKIGKAGSNKFPWKPIQRGVVLATTSLIEIANDCINNYDFNFVLTGRVSQDCLENLFSIIRSKKPLPSPLDFVRSLKQVSISQFLNVPSTSNYNVDDSDFFMDFISKPVHPVNSVVNDDDDENVSEIVNLCSLDNVPFSPLSQAEDNALYHLCGYCLYSVQKCQKVCELCISSLLNTDDVNVPDALTKLREYTEGSLVRVSSDVYCMMRSIECMFRQHIVNSKHNIKSQLLKLSYEFSKTLSLPECHDIKHKFISKFIDVRIRIYANKRSKELQVDMATSSMGSKTSAKKSLASQVES